MATITTPKMYSFLKGTPALGVSVSCPYEDAKISYKFVPSDSVCLIKNVVFRQNGVRREICWTQNKPGILFFKVVKNGNILAYFIFRTEESYRCGIWSVHPVLAAKFPQVEGVCQKITQKNLDELNIKYL